MNGCPSTDQLELLVEELLSPAEQAALARHLETCSDCQAVLEELTAAAPLDSGATQAEEGNEQDFLEQLRQHPPTHPGNPSVSSSTRPLLPGYELLRELGRGGMGVVYLARQLKLNRLIAVKMLATERPVSARELVRFQIEAEAIAALQHPNIVSVYEVGEHEGRPFLALEYVAGGSLAQQLQTAGQPLPPRDAAELVETLARAIHTAHQRGIVHRDLKPGNVLLEGGQGQRGPKGPQTEGPFGPFSPFGPFQDPSSLTPKITDFGLAKQLGGGGPTRTQEVMGTPAYMAPEQASGEAHTVGPATDVYALGAILYECLTGKPPFDGDTPIRILQQVLHTDPVPPSRQRAGVPRDLETICLKCLRKEPAQRYRSAEALAEDLRCFRTGEPIRARPVRTWERAWKWARRNPLAAGLFAAMIFVLVLIPAFGVSVYSADRNKYEGKRFNARQYRFSGQPGQRFAALEELKEAARTWAGRQPEEQRQLRDEAIACLAMTDLKLIREWPGYPPGTMIVTFDDRFEHYARGDEQGHLSVLQASDDREVARLPNPRDPPTNAYRLRFSPDGRFLAAMHHQESVLRVWDWKQERVVWQHGGGAFAWSPDGGRIALGLPGPEIGIFEIPSGRLERRFPATWTKELAFSPDGRRLAVYPRDFPDEVLLLDTTSGSLVRKLHLPARATGHPAWHPGGKYLAVGTDRQQVYLWNAHSGTVQATVPGNAGSTELAFSRNGGLLASNGWDGVLRLSDPLSSRPLLTTLTEGMASLQFGQADAPGAAPLLWTLHGHLLRVWEVHGGAGYRTLPQPAEAGELEPVSFSPDGRLLTFTTAHKESQLWDAAAGTEGALLDPHAVGVFFSPDGAWLFTGDGQGMSRWSVQRQPGLVRVGPPVTLWQHRRSLYGLRLSADGHTLLALDRGSRQVFVFDLESKGGVARVLPHPNASNMAISGDGRWAATGTWRDLEPGQAWVNVWDLHQQDQPLVPHAFPNTPDGVPSNAALLFSPDGRYLLTGLRQEYRTWQVGTWQRDPSRTLSRQEGFHAPAAMAFSNDGALLAVVRHPGQIELRDFPHNQALATLLAPGEPKIVHLSFAPDGTQLAACGVDRIQLWDLRRLRQELANLGLDWDRPPYPAVEDGPPQPLTIDIRLTAELHELRGDFYWGRQDADRALAEYEQALRLDPDREGASYGGARAIALGPAALREQNPEALARALARAEVAVRRQPANTHWRLTLGLLQLRAGQIRPAAGTLEGLWRGPAKNDVGAQVGFALALCYHHLGDSAKAQEHFYAARRWLTATPVTFPVLRAELAALQAEADALLARNRDR